MTDRPETISQVELHDLLPAPTVGYVARVLNAWRRVGEHPGITHECAGDDAAAAWNALCRLLDPLIGDKPYAE